MGGGVRADAVPGPAASSRCTASAVQRTTSACCPLAGASCASSRRWSADLGGRRRGRSAPCSRAARRSVAPTRPSSPTPTWPRRHLRQPRPQRPAHRAASPRWRARGSTRSWSSSAKGDLSDDHVDAERAARPRTPPPSSSAPSGLGHRGAARRTSPAAPTSSRRRRRRRHRRRGRQGRSSARRSGARSRPRLRRTRTPSTRRSATTSCSASDGACSSTRPSSSGPGLDGDDGVTGNVRRHRGARPGGRVPDYAHDTEPGCAVRDAVDPSAWSRAQAAARRRCPPPAQGAQAGTDHGRAPLLRPGAQTLRRRVQVDAPARRVDLARRSTRTGVADADRPGRVFVPRRIVPCSLSSHQSPRRRRTGSSPSKPSPNATNAPAPITPTTSPSNSRSSPLLEQPLLEHEAARDVVGVALDRSSPRARAPSVHSPASIEPRAVVRLLPRPDRAEQRAVADDVGVAADRRGEVAVARRAEAGVADVLAASSTPPSARAARARLGPGARGRSRGRTGRRRARSPPSPPPPATARGLLGDRRRRHVERGELVGQPLDRLGLGPLVDAVEGGQRAVLEHGRDRLVGGDHQVLDQPVRLGLLDRQHVRRRGRARRSGTRARRRRGRSRAARAPSPSAAAAARAAAQRLVPRRARRARGRRRSGRRGRSRGARRSG